jgi:hypothetical protein
MTGDQRKMVPGWRALTSLLRYSPEKKCRIHAYDADEETSQGHDRAITLDGGMRLMKLAF